MNILITGINGFVGTYLSKELQNAGHSVFGIDIQSNSENIYVADICDTDKLSNIIDIVKPDIIYHLAAIANVDYNNPQKLYDINVGGTRSILTSISRLNLKPYFIFISSSQVYGNVDERSLPISETNLISPVNHYGASKAAGESMVMAFGKEYDIPYIIFRPFNHTGPGQLDTFVVSKIVNHFRQKSSSIDLGNINTIRDYSDVRDIVRAYASVIACQKTGEVYNVSSNKGITVLQIVKILEELTGRPMMINESKYLKRSNEIQSVIGDNSKIIYELNYRVQYEFCKTLTDMLND